MNTGLEKKTALLLVGSPRGLKSTSHALGVHLLKRLAAGGMATETLIVGAALHGEKNRAAMRRSAAAADLVVVSFPLYVDQLPAPLIEALEMIASDAGNLSGAAGGRSRKLLAIVQCGFPENLQCLPACDIMKQFAREARFDWAGALSMGMGGAIGGKPLEKAGGMARNAAKALDRTAEALLAGGDIPPEAVALMAKPLMPRWFYVAMANFGMKSQAKKQGAKARLYDRPYAA